MRGSETWAARWTAIVVSQLVDRCPQREAADPRVRRRRRRRALDGGACGADEAVTVAGALDAPRLRAGDVRREHGDVAVGELLEQPPPRREATLRVAIGGDELRPLDEEARVKHIGREDERLL